MYQYTPKSAQKKEKLIVLGLFTIGALLYAGSLLPNVPLPALFQLGAFAAFTAMLLLGVRCLLTKYEYRVELREESEHFGAGYDLVILEQRAKRVRTVCRVGTEFIRSVTHVDPKNKKRIADLSHQKTLYRYTAELFSENRYVLEIQDLHQAYLLQISADSALLELLQMH